MYVTIYSTAWYVCESIRYWMACVWQYTVLSVMYVTLYNTALYVCDHIQYCIVIYVTIYNTAWYANGDWDFWISDLGEKPRRNWYLAHVVNFGEVRRAHLAKCTPHLHDGAPGIFSDLLRPVQMLKREWGTESNWKLPHLFIPSKLQPRFPSLRWKTCLWAELQPWCLSLKWKTCPWAEHSDDDDDDYYYYYYYYYYL